MLVSGKNVAWEILKKPINVKKVYLWDNFNDKDIIYAIEKHKLPVKKVSKMELDELARENHQGIIMDIADYKYYDLDYVIKDNGFLVMLDHLEDPHNFGAIIRTCEAAGVDGIIIPKDRSVEVNSTVMKTSAGALTNVKVIMVTNLKNTIDKLKDRGYWIFASDLKGQSYNKIDYKTSTCLIIGSEGNGISKIVKDSSDFIISIPMFGEINSLNASVAAGILIYEVIRQKNS